MITGPSQTIAGKHYIFTYFLEVNNKHCGRFFEVLLAALTKGDEIYMLEWYTNTFVRLRSVMLCVFVYVHLFKHLKTRLRDNCFNFQQFIVL